MPLQAAPVEAAPEPEPVNIKPMAELTMIENKFYKPDPTREPKQVSTQHGQMIANPYYQTGAKLAGTN